MSDQSTERLKWVDAARIPAMLAVVLQHVPGGCQWNMPTLSAALALFYLLAGYFVAPKLSRRGYVFRRVKVLLGAYIFWNALQAIGYLMDPEWVQFVISSPWGAMCKVLGLGCSPVLTPMWFVRDLIIFLFVGVVLQKLPQWVLPTVALFALCLHAVAPGQMYPKPYMLGDFLLGMCLARTSVADSWARLPLATHGAVVAVYACLLGMRMLAPSAVYGPLGALGIFALLSMGVLLSKLPNQKLIQDWAGATFFIYCFHLFLMAPCIGAEHLIGTSPKGVWYLIALGIDVTCAVMFCYGQKLRGRWRGLPHTGNPTS